jgi:hypothetical protein
MASKKTSRDANPDPVTGEPGSHPVATGAGTAAGGLAAGAAAGAAAGPVGAAVGAVVGGVVGGLAGKAVGEQIDPTAEDAYWRENYRQRSYVDQGSDYETYQPAYRYGWESHSQHSGKRFEDVESDLQSGWNKTKSSARLSWEKAKHAARDAWDRVSGSNNSRR